MDRRFSRREMVKWGLIAGAGVALPIGVLQIPLARIWAAESVRSPRVAPFQTQLPIPPVAQPFASDAAGDHYRIMPIPGSAVILPGRTTPIWGYNGIFPGPTIIAQRGRPVIVHQMNMLPVPIATHLHGGHTPSASDGFPTDLVAPQQGSMADMSNAAVTYGEKIYTYPNDQRAATLWYHDHRMGFTGPQVYRGLAGFYLLHDAVEAALPLPTGERDIPLMITDRTFDADGAFFYPAIDPTLTTTPGVLGKYGGGMLGDTILVNGAIQPFLPVSATRYRLRILNASNSRYYQLAMSSGQAFTQIGSDGGLLAAPQSLDTITIAPAERFDVIVDFSGYAPGTQIVLLNQLGNGPLGAVMRFDVGPRAEDASAIPARLADVAPLDAHQAARRSIALFYGLGGWTVNGRYFDPDHADATPRLGATEIWDVSADADHPFHIHLTNFQVLSRDGHAPLPEDAGWKDTVRLHAGEKVQVIMRFADYPGRYVFHCHNLEHEDMMMMARFDVVE